VPGSDEAMPPSGPGSGPGRGPHRRNAVARPSSSDAVLLAVAVATISTSAPLIAATAAPALAIGLWRNAFATLAIAPFALTRRRRELMALPRREVTLAVLSGALLAAHFATWVPSLTLTSVASSTALVATQPLWAALIARARGQHVPRPAWAGMTVAFVGVLTLTGVDLSLSTRALGGDLLALVGAVFAAAYVTVGSQVRQTVSTTTYTFVCYGCCSVVLGVACLATGQRLAGFDAATWLKLLALTAGAQLLGHSLINVALAHSSPTVVSLAILFEMPGAALLAALWLGQRPPWGVLPAAVLLLGGVALVIRGAGSPEPLGGPAQPP
jgi:drug/metabolite transporter (DMT)-like permease